LAVAGMERMEWNDRISFVSNSTLLLHHLIWQMAANSLPLLTSASSNRQQSTSQHMLDHPYELMFWQ